MCLPMIYIMIMCILIHYKSATHWYSWLPHDLKHKFADVESTLLSLKFKFNEGHY